MTFSIDIYLAKFLKTNLTKLAVIGREKASKGRFLGPVQLQITLTKEKDRRKRKIEEEERRRREKAMVALLVFIMATLEMSVLYATLYKPTFAFFYIHAFKYKNQSHSMGQESEIKVCKFIVQICNMRSVHFCF